MVIVVTGPAGAGKSLVGARLAAALGWPFYEGDAYHPAANVALMRAGTPLGDAERAPWLAALAAVVARHAAEGTSAVLACSALRRAYRAVLVPNATPGRVPNDPPGAGAVRFVYLRVGRARLAERLAAREEHFFSPSLLDSQLAALEPPGVEEPAPALAVEADRAPEVIVEEIRAAFGV